MRRSAALIAAAIALALAVGFWLFLPANVEEVGAAESGAEAVATPELAAELGAALDSTGPERRDSDLAEPVAAGVAPGAPTKGASSSLRAVQVLRATDHGPMGGVEVLWWPAPARDVEALDELGLWLERSGDDASLPPGHERALSSEQGVVLLPDAAFGIQVFARCEGWSGRASFASGETPPMRIVLHRDAALAVRVLDVARQPAAGVTVGIAGDLSMRGYSTVRAVTDEQGLARFPHAYIGMQGELESTQRLAVVLEELTEQPVGREFDPQRPPTEPIELVLPLGGECEVRVLDRNGELAKGPFDVQVATVGEDELDLEEFQPWWGNDVVTRRSVLGGVALFRGVAPGLSLVATVSTTGGLANYSARVPRIRRAGERVVAEIKLEGRHRIVGSVLREAGTPLADAALGLRYLWDDDEGGLEQSYELEVRPHTDAQGRFSIEVSLGDWGGEDGEGRFDLVQLDPRGEAVARARMELPSERPPGEYDVGVLRMVTIPVFASGVTLDAERRPVGGVRVSVYVYVPDNYGEPEEDLFPAEFALSDSQGRFSLRMPPQHLRARLEARKDELRSERVAVERGASGVELVLAPAGGIAGRVEWEGLSSGVRLHVVPLLEADDPGAEPPQWTPVLADGQFFVRGLQPGRYTVEIRSSGGSDPLASVNGVEVRRGETTRDPRLDPLALGATARVATLTIVDGSGQPLSEGLNIIGRYKNASGGDDYEWIPLQSGRAVVIIPDVAPAVSVMGTEYLTEYIERLDDDRTVVMRRAPTAHFRLTQRVTLPPDITLGVSLEHELGDRAGFSWDFEQPEFDENGRASVRMRHLGNYKLLLRATLRGEVWKSMPLDMPALELHVRELPAEQTFEVTCPEEPLQVVLEALRRP